MTGPCNQDFDPDHDPIEDLSMKSKPTNRQVWPIVVVVSLMVLLGFVGFKYAGWSAGLADTKSPLLETSSDATLSAPMPTVAAQEQPAITRLVPVPDLDKSADISVDKNGLTIVSNDTIGEAVSMLLRSPRPRDLTVAGDLQACLAAQAIDLPIRTVEEVTWSEGSQSTADAWMIVVSSSSVKEINAKGAFVKVVVMPKTCGTVATGDASASASSAVATSYYVGTLKVEARGLKAIEVPDAPTSK